VWLVARFAGASQRGWTIPNATGIAIEQLYLGKPTLISVQPGSYNNNSPGWINFPVPNYGTLTVTIRGAGGGGNSDTPTPPPAATNGENSSFPLPAPSTSVIALGGLAGVASGAPPANQGGSGGTVTVGGGAAGGNGINSITGAGSPANAGSAGGRVTKTWARTASDSPVPGSIVSVYIGAGGQAALSGKGYAGPGGSGSLNITWS